MKKLVTTCVLLTTVTMASFAQSKATGKSTSPTPAPASAPARGTATPEQLAERRSKVLQTQLGLTADQYTTVYATELDYEMSGKNARDNGYEPGPGQSMQMNMARDQRHKAVMTPAQYAKYEATAAGGKK